MYELKDLMYIYDKNTFLKSELGEIQTGFNISPVVDGTKDSCKVEVFNYEEKEVEPWSIIKHEATNTWWVVSHDKVERYPNENNTYLYKHNLELTGAFELLNARDLIDSGYNQNRYTIERFIKRLFSMSTFEFRVTDYNDDDSSHWNLTINDNNAIDLTKTIDYVKTFENYTPLSALRELLDGYNCSAKLRFVESGNYIVGAIIDIVSKTGNTNKEPIDGSIFNNVQELKTMDKNSFGTTVISNAQNVISTKTKTYPSSGLVKPTGRKYEFNGRNGSMVVRLPSPAYKVNWVDMATKTKFTIIQKGHYTITETFNPFDDESVKRAFSVIQNQAESWGILNEFNENININMLKEVGYQRFYYEDNYDPDTKQFISDNYIPIRSAVGLLDEYQTVLSNKEMKENVQNVDNVFYCDRGSDLIDGFTFFGDSGLTKDKIDFKPHNERIVYSVTTGGYTYYVILGDFVIESNQEPRVTKQTYYIPDLGFSINYIPMSDIKIKLDNSGIRKDSQLYNQNGKLTDSVALSKSLLSYSKEIESDNITRYGTYYVTYENDNGTITRVNNIPQVGELVNISGNLYVINNISMNFYPNDNENYGTKISYYVECEFTMSKNIATKSLMVNPNTNIRDYGIPQNFNVKRKQLYRDFYELSHSQESNLSTWKLPLDRILNISNEYRPYQEHTAIIKVDFEGGYGSNDSSTWYYQLESTTFVLKKSIYEVIDFKDNNIIGYGSQNIWSGFDISRVIDGQHDMINTPISYVDTNGEFKSIELLFSTNVQLTDIYKEYITQESAGSSTYGAFYSCFIPEDIYTKAIQRDRGIDNDDTIFGYEFSIIETNYLKDATEVPIFEYCCQLDDTSQVIIGSNVFDTYEQDNAYLYSFVFINKDRYNDNNYSLNEITKPSINQNNIATLQKACKLAYENGKLVIRLYQSIGYDLINKQETYLGDPTTFQTNKDLMIIRHRILNEDLYLSVVGELISLQVYVNLPTPTNSYENKYAVKNDDKYYQCVSTGNVDTFFTRGQLFDNGATFGYVVGGNTYMSTIFSCTINLSVLSKVAASGQVSNNYAGGTVKVWHTGIIINDPTDIANYGALIEQTYPQPPESGDNCRIIAVDYEQLTGTTWEVVVRYALYNQINHLETVDANIYLTYHYESDYQETTLSFNAIGSRNTGNQYYYVDTRFYKVKTDSMQLPIYTTTNVTLVEQSEHEYTWNEIDNANNKFFTYNNTLYKYTSYNNQFVQMTSNVDIERQDLIFIVKDLAHASIDSNSISLCINYFETE